MPLRVTPKAIEQDFGPFTFPGLIVEGGNPVARGGIGFATVAFHGADSSRYGPHVQLTTDVDDYPLFAIVPYSRDNIHILFDAYYDGTFRSSDAGSNFRIRKRSDSFYIEGEWSAAQAAAISWDALITFTSTVVVGNQSLLTNLDFKWSGDTISNLLLVDTSADMVRIYGGIALQSNTQVISGGEITIVTSHLRLDTEGGAATDDLDTINGGVTGMVVVVRSLNNARDPTLKDGTGNLRLNGDFALLNTNYTMVIFKGGTNWQELCRSAN